MTNKDDGDDDDDDDDDLRQMTKYEIRIEHVQQLKREQTVIIGRPTPVISEDSALWAFWYSYWFTRYIQLLVYFVASKKRAEDVMSCLQNCRVYQQG